MNGNCEGCPAREKYGNWIVSANGTYVKVIDQSCLKYKYTAIPSGMLLDFFGIDSAEDVYRFNYLYDGQRYTMRIVKAYSRDGMNHVYKYRFQDEVRKRIEGCTVGKDTILFRKNGKGMIIIEITGREQKKEVACKKIVYNKLVRDRIPEIIAADSHSCDIRILSDKEYLRELKAKLNEELNEYLASGEVEELADLEEVLRAILDAKGVSYDEFEKIRLDKKKKRGGFGKKLFLLSTSQDEN